MRILLYIFGFIATCFLGFFLIGLFFSEIKYENAVTIQRPVNKSWKVFIDESLMKDWMEGFVRIDTIKGKPHEEGSKFKLIVKEDGNEFEVTETVVRSIPEKEYSLIIENEILTNHVNVLFSEPAAMTTQITFHHQVKAKNWFMRSLFVFFKSEFKDMEQKNLDNLKHLIESDPNPTKY